MTLIYVTFIENGLTCFFPGGAVQYLPNTTFTPSDRIWYIAVQNTMNKIGVNGYPFIYDPIISNYRAASNGNLVFTISIPIIMNNN